MTMTRMEFLRSLLGLGAGALVIGCTDGGGSPGPADASPNLPSTDAAQASPDAPMQAPGDAGGDAGGGTCGSTTTTIGTNHGHTAVVPAADVAAGVMKTYDIQGSSGHPHTITVTAAMFAMLKAGSTVNVVSSNDANHTHAVTIKCA